MDFAFSPDGKNMASADSDGTVRVWDVITGQMIGGITIAPPIQKLSALAFRRDGCLALGSEDGTVQVWDMTTGREAFTFRGHTGRVSSLTFSPDGRRLVSGGEDKLIKIWDIHLTGQGALTLTGHTSRVNSLAFSPDGLRLASGSADGTVRVWDGTHLSINEPGH
jgi:WD40 repeat protein